MTYRQPSDETPTPAGLVAACVAGLSTAVEITGDPGSGRTHLLREFTTRATAAGLAVTGVTGDAHPVPHGTRGVLRYADDADHAPAPVRDALAGLLARSPAVPTVVAWTRTRAPLPDRPDDALTAHVGAVYRVARLRVEPLDAQRLARLLPPGTGPARRALLHTLGAGNRGWLEALTPLPDDALRDLARTGLCAPVPEPPPGSGWHRALAAPTDDEKTVLRYAAVLGTCFSPAPLTALTGWDLPRVLGALDGLAAHRLVLADPTGAPLFRFAHPALRVLAHAQLPPGRRITAHAAAAAHLARAGAPAPERAPHLARSAAPGDGAAARTLGEAARQVLDTDPRTAADWFAAAVRVGAGTGAETTGNRFQLCVAAARAGDTARFEEEARVLLSASPPLPAADRARLADLRVRLHSATGREREARAELRSALAEAGGTVGAVEIVPAPVRTPDGPAARQEALARAALHARAASLAAERGDGRGARDHAAAAARTGADTAARWRTTVDAALARDAVHSSDAAHRDAVFARGGAAVDALTDAELTDRLDAVGQLARAHSLSGRPDRAARLLARGVGCARAGRRTLELALLLPEFAWAQVRLGRLSAARETAAEAEEAALALGGVRAAHRARWVSVAALLWSEGADGALPAARDLCAADGLPAALRRPAVALTAAVLLAADRPDEALDLLVGCAADRAPSPAETAGDAPWWSLAARAAAAAGRSGAAHAWAARAHAEALRVHIPTHEVAALRARAAVAPDDEAVTLLARAAGLSADSGCLLTECRVRLDLAERLMGAGRLREAAVQAGLAKSGAEPTGSAPLRRAAVAVQRALGARGPRARDEGGGSPPAGPGLSPREAEICAMVCRGLSNRAVAETLFVSVKTVEAHLTRVFRKTGIRSRAALVAAFAPSSPVGV
ncbi:LuxR C-terminal-related transcriptional regulator [Streptomyces sp. NPDC008150]|uniref:LuxR C-terminal-related transcriptional regulator n=1 Tax=Streptomyces sp. NPDC008150 TaxID=3364816 RepID=UPI0036ED14C1